MVNTTTPRSHAGATKRTASRSAMSKPRNVHQRKKALISSPGTILSRLSRCSRLIAGFLPGSIWGCWAMLSFDRALARVFIVSFDSKVARSHGESVLLLDATDENTLGLHSNTSANRG